MPIYEYVCGYCEKKQQRFLPIARYQEPQYCHNPDCCRFVSPDIDLEKFPDLPATPMTKIVSAPYVAPDYPGYISPATGKWVEGKRQHIEDLKQSNCRILEPGESRQEFKKAEQRLERLHKQIDDAVDQTARELGINA